MKITYTQYTKKKAKKKNEKKHKLIKNRITVSILGIFSYYNDDEKGDE